MSTYVSGPCAVTIVVGVICVCCVCIYRVSAGYTYYDFACIYNWWGSYLGCDALY